MKNKHIVLGITGSVAAFKGCELASTLTAQGFTVRTVLTRAAERFVTPLSLQALTGNPCYTELLGVCQPADSGDMHHISLAEQASLIVVAPATADCIARCAQGRASDLLSSVILTTRAPVLMAPAMNVGMYRHPLTRRNIATLRDIGYHFIGPEKGRLACGVHDMGRMSEPADIMTRIKSLIKTHKNRT